MSGKDIKVNFLLIGAARSATTSISNILASHPDICFSNPKEPQFFSDPDWRESLQDYHTLFSRECKLRGEGSTNYSKFPSFNRHIHRDIFEYNPDIKIIYIMRHPVDRLVSHYRFSIERGLTEDTLEQAIQLNPIYINTSKYYSQIKPYIDLFGRQNIHLVIFDDFQLEPEKTMSEIWRFLGLEPSDKTPADQHLNKSGKGRIGHMKFDNPKGCSGKAGKLLHLIRRYTGLRKPEYKIGMSAHLKRQLEQEFQDEISGIEQLTGRDLSHWRNF